MASIATASLYARIISACRDKCDDAAATARLTALLAECPSPEACAALLAQARPATWCTPLALACTTGNLATARVLCDAGAIAETGDGCTPLMRASFGGHLDLVRFLVLERNAAASKGGHAALLASVSVGGNVDIMGILLRVGADVAPCLCRVAWTAEPDVIVALAAAAYDAIGVACAMLAKIGRLPPASLACQAPGTALRARRRG
jgi:hypothetical protein